MISCLADHYEAPVLSQQGVGSFCEPQLPGRADWIGQDVVFQVIQHAPDGQLYQVTLQLLLCSLSVLSL